jgi:hypothetical protein
MSKMFSFDKEAIRLKRNYGVIRDSGTGMFKSLKGVLFSLVTVILLFTGMSQKPRPTIHREICLQMIPPAGIQILRHWYFSNRI